MNHRSSWFPVYVSMALLVVVRAAAQDNRPMSMTAGFSNGATVELTTITEPGGGSPQWIRLRGGVMADSGAIVHRYFTDENSSIYFGYDLEVERLAEAGRFRVSIKPLSVAWEKTHPQDSVRHVPPTSLPSYPSPQLVQEGDIIALDVFVSPRTGNRIVDRMRISGTWAFSVSKAGTPSDFQLSDVELHLVGPSLTLNGQVIASSPDGAIAGPIVWVYAPGRGRFVFSIQPHEGYAFRLAGTIQGTRLTFQSGADVYELRCTEPILRPGGRWNLYVLEDPGTIPRSSGPQPMDESGRLFFGAADRIERAQIRK